MSYGAPDEQVLGHLVFQVHLLLADLGREQRRLGAWPVPSFSWPGSSLRDACGRLVGGADGRARGLAGAAHLVGVMALGGALGITAIALPFIEGGILMSLLVLGVLIAAAVRLPLLASLAIGSRRSRRARTRAGCDRTNRVPPAPCQRHE